MLNEFLKKEAPIQGLAGMGGGVPSRLLTLASGERTYIDDVFSTFLWTGDSTNNRDIVNGIDLDGEGGLVWIKRRSGTDNNILYDTERGGTKFLTSDTTNTPNSNDGLSFNSNGFRIALNSQAYTNPNGTTFCSWTFRKCPGFFDVVTYTGSGSVRTIAHNLRSVPGSIWVKRLDTSADWRVYHRSLTNASKQLYLNDSAAENSAGPVWNSTDPTSSVFTVGTDSAVNANNGTYVAYLFAHNDGSFGESSNEAVIKCGSFTTNSSGEATVNLGFEPQWFLIKKSSGTSDWYLVDNMRGFLFDENDQFFKPNEADADNLSKFGYPTATGWSNVGETGNFPANETWVYWAIRRPHKPPESGTEVFAIDAGNSSSTIPCFDSTFPVDLGWTNTPGSVNGFSWFTRLCGKTRLVSYNTNNEGTSYNNAVYDSNVGFYKNEGSSTNGYMFRRAAKFFDVVVYEGTGSATNINHNLTVEPELVIIKSRSASGSWVVGSTAFSSGGHLVLDETGGLSNIGGTARFVYANWSSTVLGIGADTDVNNSGTEYVAYLFASLDSVSKIGTYTGDGGNNNYQNVTSSEPRLVLIKRTDSTGGWYVFDYARGSGSGNDPYLLLNSTAAQVTGNNLIHTNAIGFTPFGDININNAEYVYLLVL